MTAPITCRMTFEEGNKAIIEGDDVLRNILEKVALITVPLLRERIEKRYSRLFFYFLPEEPPLNLKKPEAFFSHRALHVFAPKFERERDLIRMILQIFIGIFVGDTPFSPTDPVHVEAQKNYGTLLSSLLNEEIPSSGSAFLILGKIPPSLRLLLLKPELDWLKVEQTVGFPIEEISLVKEEAFYLMELCRLKAEETFQKNPPLSRRFNWEMVWPPNCPSFLFLHYLFQIKEVASEALTVELDNRTSKTNNFNLLIHALQRLPTPGNTLSPLKDLLLMPPVMDHIKTIAGDQLNDIQIYQGQSATCTAIIYNKYLYLMICEDEPKYLFLIILALLEVALVELKKHPEERYILARGQKEDEILSALPSSRREALLSLLSQLDGFAVEMNRIRASTPKNVDLKGGSYLDDLPRQIRPRRLAVFGGNRMRPPSLTLVDGSATRDLDSFNDRKDS